MRIITFKIILITLEYLAERSGIEIPTSEEDGTNTRQILKDKVYKILILGDYEVGKFSFLIRYVDNVFLVNSNTHIGVDYRSKYVQLESGEKIDVQLWHIPGQERFLNIAKNYYKASHGILLLYDVKRQNSFDKVRKLIQIIKEESNKKTIIFLIGNKIDKNRDREITT